MGRPNICEEVKYRIFRIISEFKNDDESEYHPKERKKK